MSTVDPLTGSAVVEAVSVISDPDGAKRGTLSHAEVSAARPQRAAMPRKDPGARVNIGAINILVPMHLAGQVQNARGYAMAALLISMAITALLMTAAMPVWKQMAQREKEEELVFRGQ